MISDYLILESSSELEILYIFRSQRYALFEISEALEATKIHLLIQTGIP